MRTLPTATALLFLVTTASLMACDDSSRPANGAEGNLEAFVRLGDAQDLDYEPLRSPAQAVENSAAIVVAHDLRVVGDLEIHFRGQPRSYPSVLIRGEVDETISGDVAGEFYIVHGLWDGSDPEAFKRTLPTTPVLLFLFDLENPDVIQDELPGPSYEIAIDGMWFRTADGDVVSGRSYVPKEEKEWFWGPIDSFDHMVQMVRDAAGTPAAATNTIGPAPIFRGEINGIELGVESGPLPECGETEIAAVWERALADTFYDLGARDLPAQPAGPPQVGVCADDGRVIWIIAQYDVGSRAVQISRWENVRWYRQEYPESRISTGTIAGRPAVFVDRAPSGLGQTAVFVVDEDNNGSTALLSSDLPLDSLQAIAEALYGPARTVGPGEQRACLGDLGYPDGFGGRTVDDLFCVMWEDRWDDEVGFVVKLTYDNEPLTLTFELPPDTREFVFPPEHQPNRFTTHEECLRRKDWSIEVRAVLSDTEVLLGGMAANGECGGP